MSARIVIVGASMAGLRTAEFLRSSGFDGSITVCGSEPCMPYNRPPLSKEILTGEGGREQALKSLSFRVRPSLADVRWALGDPVLHASLEEHRVTTVGGQEFRYDALVAATGLRPQRLPFEGGSCNRYVLRTVDDAIALKSALVPGRRVVVIGGGFIGCEVAAVARKIGLDVSVVEPMKLPMLRAIGAELASAMVGLHSAEGVRFRLGVGVRRFELDAATDCVREVVLADGTSLAADLVVEAVGSVCNVEWLQGNGLDLTNGVLCDGRMAAEGSNGVYAVGDIARFPNAFADEQARRMEHWCIPTLTARRAVESLMGELASSHVDATFDVMPSFWSDQHGLRIQSFGMPVLADSNSLMEGELTVEGMRGGGVAVGHFRKDRLVGVTCVGVAPDKLARYRDHVAAAHLSAKTTAAV